MSKSSRKNSLDFFGKSQTYLSRKKFRLLVKIEKMYQRN